MTLPVITTRSVPCGTCSECCRGDAIFLHPESGDDPSQYQTTQYAGRTILEHKPNGDCIYLVPGTGCGVHGRQPVVCREMDCRLLVDRLGEKFMQQRGMGRIVHAARRLRKNGVGSAGWW